MEPPNSEQLQAIRDRDAAGPENLQMFPPVWEDRRSLLALIDAQDKDWTIAKQAAEFIRSIHPGPYSPPLYNLLVRVYGVPPITSEEPQPIYGVLSPEVVTPL